MSQSTTSKIEARRAQWIARTATIHDITHEQAYTLLSTPRSQSVRINSLKGTQSEVHQELRELGWLGEAVQWCENGLSVEAGLESINNSALVSDGKVYIQNAASWLPVLSLDIATNDTVLDVCAAPGGKTAHIAAIAENRAVITANDNSRVRLAKLRANLHRLGVENAQYTLFDATQIGKKFEHESFTKILVDAPCSGEGMKVVTSDEDVSRWSVAHIKRLQQLQKKIITQAWQLLAPGGTLVYSTCTMAPEENEAVIDYLLRRQSDATIMEIPITITNEVPCVKNWNGRTFDERIGLAKRMKPEGNVEAFFLCKLTKLDSTNSYM